MLALLHDLHDRLRITVGSLSPDDLRASAYPSEWTVADVLSHLGSGSEIALLRARAEGSDGPGQEEMAEVWAVWNARTPEQQAVESVTAIGAYLHSLDELDDAQLEAIRAELGGLDLDASRVIGLRVAELAMHIWDIEVAGDETATVSDDAVPVLLDVLPVTIRWAARPPHEQDPMRVVVHLEDVAADYLLELGGGGGHLVPVDPDDGGIDDGGTDDGGTDGRGIDATLTGSADAFLRLVYGRLDPAHTPHVTVGGGADLDLLRGCFPGL
ncbi:MAG: hypothetical protein QOJ60_2376 [Actinomycetota bacterium]|jgi:uncharacterized protein (TIGR03083 family)|nr:hypothetical protein [Actinomycetota bacterium]